VHAGVRGSRHTLRRGRSGGIGIDNRRRFNVHPFGSRAGLPIFHQQERGLIIAEEQSSRRKYPLYPRPLLSAAVCPRN
jgi:hypothetical protein